MTADNNSANMDSLAKKWAEQDIATYPKGVKVKVGPVKANQHPWDESVEKQLGQRQQPTRR